MKSYRFPTGSPIGFHPRNDFLGLSLLSLFRLYRYKFTWWHIEFVFAELNFVEKSNSLSYVKSFDISISDVTIKNVMDDADSK